MQATLLDCGFMGPLDHVVVNCQFLEHTSPHSPMESPLIGDFSEQSRLPTAAAHSTQAQPDPDPVI